jgi:hypothetical protein
MNADEGGACGRVVAVANLLTAVREVGAGLRGMTVIGLGTDVGVMVVLVGNAGMVGFATAAATPNAAEPLGLEDSLEPKITKHRRQN